MHPLALIALVILIPVIAIAQDGPAPDAAADPDAPMAGVAPEMGGLALPDAGARRPQRRGGEDGHDGRAYRGMLAHHGGGMGAPGNARFTMTSEDRTLMIDCGDSAIDDCIAGAAPLIELMD